MNLLVAHRKTYDTIYSKSTIQARIEAAISGKRAENLGGTITPEGRFSLHSKGWQPVGNPGSGYWVVMKGKIIITDEIRNKVRVVFYPNTVLLLIIYIIVGATVYMLFIKEYYQIYEVIVSVIMGTILSLLLRYQFLRLQRNFKSLLK